MIRLRGKTKENMYKIIKDHESASLPPPPCSKPQSPPPSPPIADVAHNTSTENESS